MFKVNLIQKQESEIIFNFKVSGTRSEFNDLTEEVYTDSLREHCPRIHEFLHELVEQMRI
jgi:hypothetical protein